MEDLAIAMSSWSLLRRAPFLQIAKNQGSLSWPFLPLRRILAGGDEQTMFTASLNKGRNPKAQPTSPEQGWRHIPSASSPVQSCLWHRIMTLCNLAWGQEGVCACGCSLSSGMARVPQEGRTALGCHTGTCHHILIPTEWAGA